eukprot:TRINITY_DN2461_c0_g2_i2.p1 TRINITY_DN2461_c0_g2~~TRINITY_DN2461_c0_g2_i2.p1  ORF type:complete len:198 (+),score=54.83 TRINITY_DN2461_c0_g2_i2:135-728(+)
MKRRAQYDLDRDALERNDYELPRREEKPIEQIAPVDISKRRILKIIGPKKVVPEEAPKTNFMLDPKALEAKPAEQAQPVPEKKVFSFLAAKASSQPQLASNQPNAPSQPESNNNNNLDAESERPKFKFFQDRINSMVEKANEDLNAENPLEKETISDDVIPLETVKSAAETKVEELVQIFKVRITANSFSSDFRCLS